MSPRLPPLKARDVIRCLQELGFIEMRRNGSHIFFQHPNGSTTVVQDHQGEDIGRGLLRAILRETDISLEDFLNTL